MLAYLPLLHPTLTFIYFFRSANYLLSASTILIFYYTLLQLGFELVSHNFGVKNFFFFNNNTALLVIFFYLPTLLTILTKKTFLLLENLNLIFGSTPLYLSNLSKFFKITPHIISVAAITLSLFPILHHLLISFLGIDFCNKEPTFWVFRYSLSLIFYYLLTTLLAPNLR
jgi:hypothetical protein